MEHTKTIPITRAASVILSALIASAVGCGDGDGLVDGIFTSAEVARLESLGPLPALAGDPTNRLADDPGAAALGQRLFFESGYSGPLITGDDGTNGGLGAAGERGKVSCRSCHLRE